MKKFSRSTLFLSLIFILCFGLFFASLPSKVATAAGSSNTTENSGGFIVQADKVEGSMNPVTMATGDVVMGEGKIYGLTITKKLEKSKPALIIKIKSQGPIPVQNLKGKLMGLPQFSSPCLPSQLGWLCLNDVKMKLSEQTVGSISLPNAVIETCFEGQCDVVDPNINGKALGPDQTGLADGLGKQLDQLNEMIGNAKDLQGLINKEKDTLQQLIEEASRTIGLPGELESLTKQIGESYQELLKNVDQLASLIGSSNQLLSQITDKLTQNDKSGLVKGLNQSLQEITDQTKGIQNEMTTLKNQQQSVSKSLGGFKEDINHLTGLLIKNKDRYTGGLLDRILNNLGDDSIVENVLPPTPISSNNATAGNDTGFTNDTTNAEDSKTIDDNHNGGTTNGDTPDPTAELEKQLNDTIQGGKGLVDKIQPTLDIANQKIDKLDQLSGLLTGVNMLLGNIINSDNADEFQTDLKALQSYIKSLADPVQQLKDTLSKAESLQSELGENSPDLQGLKDTLTQVKAIKTRLHDEIRKRLVNLPVLDKIQLFIQQIDEMIDEIDSWDI